MHYWETEEFKKLDKKWKQKLEAAGFDDIEVGDHFLKRPILRISELYCPHSENYYSLARSFLLTFQFTNQIDKKIWELHSKGLSLREIEAELASKKLCRLYKTGAKSYKKSQINVIIKRLQTVMLSTVA